MSVNRNNLKTLGITDSGLSGAEAEALRVLLVAASVSLRRNVGRLRSLLGRILDGSEHPSVLAEVGRSVGAVERRAADALIADAERRGVEVLSPFDPAFPDELRRIPDPPLALYIRGMLPRSVRVAVVGARQASDYGTSVARMIARHLTERGIAVVSGLARGCDTAAHEGAVAVTYRSSPSEIPGTHPGVAILGSGVHRIYPPENGPLAGELLDRGGAVISEYGCDDGPERHHFPERNRLISALSDVLVVAEAKERSGALITARSALEQGRDVLAVPGPITSELSTGTNRLIADGARVLVTVDDVIDALPVEKQLLIRPRPVLESARGARTVHSTAAALSGSAGELRALAEQLVRGGACSVDDLVDRSGLPAERVLALLSELQLVGAIRCIRGSCYTWDGTVDTPEIFEQILRS